MPNMMQLKAFEPVDDGPARLNNAQNKAGIAIRAALRPCGVTAYEAADQINAAGGSAYSPSYTKSAQFARSYYGQMSFGAYGQVERIGDHLACVRAYAGDDQADATWASLPESLQDSSTQVLVIYAYAAGGRAVGRYGVTTLSDLPADADDAAARRAKLGRKAKRNQRSGQRQGQQSKRGQSGQRSQRKRSGQRSGQSQGQSKAADADAVASALTGQTGDTGQSVEPQGDSQAQGEGQSGEPQGHASADTGEGQGEAQG